MADTVLDSPGPTGGAGAGAGAGSGRQDDDAPGGRPYRSKKILPCDLCRSRRVACLRTAAASPCSLCSRRGAECTFTSRPGPRKRPGYLPRSARKQAKDAASSPSQPPTPRTGLDPLEARVRFADLEAQGGSVAGPPPATAGQTMAMTGYTCFFSGSSSDQGPDILRHLNFGTHNYFGTSLWSAWRVLPRVDDPVYFTILPDQSLDTHSQMYTPSALEELLQPDIPELIRLFYTYANPCYPIMEPQQDFLTRRENGTVRATLLCCVYLVAMEFWDTSPALRHKQPPDCSRWWNEIFLLLTTETRAPNTDTVKALLLYMQLSSRHIRAPNRPGHWELNCMLIGVAQDIGLNLDPSDWAVPGPERKQRRVLWWAVYSHDKWMSHWLGRPSHVAPESWNVLPLALHDFSDDSSRLHVDHIASCELFIRFTQLSCILDDVLRAFYTVRHGLGDAALAGRGLLDHLDTWVRQGQRPLRTMASEWTLKIASYTVDLSIRRAVLRRVGFDSAEMVQSALQTCQEVLRALDEISDLGIRGLWLSYCTGSLELIGSVLISLCIASVEDGMLEDRRNLLFDFQAKLDKLSRSNVSTYETGRLPLVRLNSILSQIFPNL